MSDTLQPKYPLVCEIILALALGLGGLGTFGGFIYLHHYFPDNSNQRTAEFLLANAVLCWLLAVSCLVSAWKLWKVGAAAKRFAKVIWILVAIFTVWILSFDGLQGWSVGGVVEVATWTILEIVIGTYLLQKHRG